MVRLLGDRVSRVTTRTERIPNLPGSIDPNKTRMDSCLVPSPRGRLPVGPCVPSPCRIRTYPFPSTGAEALQSA
jgi:hypothetical protein